MTCRFLNGESIDENEMISLVWTRLEALRELFLELSTRLWFPMKIMKSGR